MNTPVPFSGRAVVLPTLRADGRHSQARLGSVDFAGLCATVRRIMSRRTLSSVHPRLSSTSGLHTILLPILERDARGAASEVHVKLLDVACPD
jgi:hypothetical protein